jgi:hypothetical protein
MEMVQTARWIDLLEDEDLSFIKRFILFSGFPQGPGRFIQSLLSHSAVAARSTHPKDQKSWMTAKSKTVLSVCCGPNLPTANSIQSHSNSF